MTIAKKRNSLIEFFRFFFALNVVKNHGYFPYRTHLFSPGRVSVEFFFVLSGFLLRKSLDKYTRLPYFQGLLLMLKNKVVALGIPFLIGYFFIITRNYLSGMDIQKVFVEWGYLWYVFNMFFVDIFYFTVRKFGKSEKWFFIITAVVFVITASAHAIPQCFEWGYLRAFSTMSLGILISYIPSIKLKKQWLFIIPVVVLFGYVLRILLFDFTFIEEEILDLLIYPALIYFTFQLPIHNKVLNYLGALSFGLYAYQAVPQLLWVYNIGNAWIYFFIIVGLTVLTDAIMRLIRFYKQKQFK